MSEIVYPSVYGVLSYQRQLDAESALLGSQSRRAGRRRARTGQRISAIVVFWMTSHSVTSGRAAVIVMI